MTKLILILVLIVFLLWFLQKLPQTKITEPPVNLLVNGFIKAKIDLAIRVFAHSFSVSFPLMVFGYLPVLHTFLYSSTFIVLALLINPDVRIKENSDLMISKCLIKKVATLHLRNPYQDFTMRTYKELLFLVESLPNYGVRQIKLSSPMFYHPDGTLRDFSTLEKLLTKKNAILSSYEAKPWQNLLGKISMMIDSAKDKKEKLRNINLNKWHVLTIKMEG
jgi:hypothetical protein